MVVIEVKEKVVIEDGKKTGTISRIENRTTEQGYEYTDIYIKMNELDREIKYSAPTRLSEGTKLYALVSVFSNIEPGDKVDLDNVLIGQRVSFMTINKPSKTGKGIFAEIVEGSIKQIK